MGKKVVSYQQLLKEAISEFDTSKNVDVKGPMLDPILSYEGDGELPTYKDAASVLERYYFNQTQDKGVEVSEADYENDKGVKSKKGSEHTEGPGGEEQAGTSDAATIPASKDEKGKDIAKEDEDLDGGESLSEKEWDEKDVPKKKKYHDESEEVDLSEEVENAVIEKLIAEMEEEDDEDKEDEEEDKKDVKVESDGNPSTDFKGVSDAPQEKKAKTAEDDTKGAGGTEQAGTGTDNGQVPDRKDRADQMVKPKNYNEQDEPKAPEGDEGGEEEEKDLDVDEEVKESKKEVKEVATPSAVPGGPNPDKDDDDELEEAFNLFLEEIEEDEPEEGEEEGEDKEEK
jgi:hypothetical protein